MIIYPSGLILSASEAVSLSLPRIGYQTWLRDLTATSITASSSDSEGASDAPLRPDTAEYWLPTALPATWQIDLGQLRDIEYVGIAGHTLGSSGCSVLVETSTGDLVGSPEAQEWNTFATEVSPTDDAPLIFLDDLVTIKQIRITITGTTLPRIAVIYAGPVLAMQNGLSGGTPINLSRETVLHRSLSKGGQFLGQGYRRLGIKGSASFKGLTPSWYRQTFDPFVKAARKYPYFFAWNPENYPLEVAYCWATEDIVPSYMGVDPYMQVSWNMQGIGHE